jgi:rare lipoprotein A (peptidoglycan hydrolase)
MSLVLALALGSLGVPVPAPAAPGLADVQSQAAAARAKLAAMQSQLATRMSLYASASKNLLATKRRIEQQNARLREVRASLSAGQNALDNQAEFLYRTDGAGFVDVLLGSATFEQFASRLSVLQTIAEKNAGLIVSLKSERAEEQSLLADLNARESDQARDLDAIANERDAMQGALDDQQSYYSSLSAQVAAQLAAQEKAATRERETSSGGSQPDMSNVGSGGSTDASVKLKLASVEGQSGKYWVMDNDSSSFSATGVKFSGGATIYSVADNGTGTASGHPLNDNELTCAHRTLPFGTRIAVTHGSRRIIVKVTDRGPYTSGRVIDLTPRGASLLGIDGVGTVSCEVVEGN